MGRKSELYYNGKIKGKKNKVEKTRKALAVLRELHRQKFTKNQILPGTSSMSERDGDTSTTNKNDSSGSLSVGEKRETRYEKKNKAPGCSGTWSHTKNNKTTEQDPTESADEIKVFCPKCDSDISHTAEGIQEPQNDLKNYYQHKLMNQEPRLKPTASLCYNAPNKSEDSSELTKLLLHHTTTHKPVKRKYEDTVMPSTSSYSTVPVKDQTKILIAKVYHYFEQEYEELKTIYGDLDLTPLSKFRQRTALATGVSETTVLQILKEEEERNAEKREEPPQTRSKTRKRSIQMESSSEDDSPDDDADANEQSTSFHEAQMLVVKVEPSEYYNEEPEIYAPTAAAVKVELSDIEVKEEQAQSDPISVEVKTELSPRSDVLDNTIETLALTEPAATKRKGRKVPKRSDVTSTRQHTHGESSTAAASSSVRLTEELDKGSLFGDTGIKAEEIEFHEEGFS